MITGIRRRTPFPGITWDGVVPLWEDANGSGIWLSPGSDGNEIVGNTFADIAAYEVVVEGDSNRVAMNDSADAVRDLGTGNRVEREAPAEELQHRERLVAVVRTTTSQADGEQAYIPLYANGAASGLVVVYLEGGRLFGTSIPDTWEWVDEGTIEICGSVNTLRNEVGFEPMERDCGTIPIMGKELDLDGDGTIDLVETVTILHPDFYRDRPGGSPDRGR